MVTRHSATRVHHDVTLAVLTFTGAAFAFQQTMVIPALPVLKHDLHTTTAWVTWVLTAFLLTASVATPILGKLGDQYGKERMLVVALSVFLAGAIGSSVAWNIWSLIAFRALQGAGGAIFPLSFSIIRDEFPRERIGTAVGVISSTFGIGGGLALVLSGVIVDHLSWRYLFIFGSLGIALAAVLVHLFVPESPIKTPSKVDLPGAALLSSGLLSLLLALTEAESWGWTSARIVALLLAAAVLLVLWSRVELRVAEPMVDIRMLTERTVLLTNATAILAGFALFGAFILLPNFAETPRGLSDAVGRLVDYGFGASTTRAGLYLLPGSLAGLFSGAIAGAMGKRWGSKWPLALGMLLGALGIAVMAQWHGEPWHLVVGMLLLGGGLPFTFAAMATLIVGTVKETETGIATGMNSVMRLVGGVIGGQVGAAILSSDTISGTSVPSESAFTTAFWIAAVFALLGAVIALFVTPPRRLRLRVAEAAE